MREMGIKPYFSRVEISPYALTRAPQGAMRVDRRSRIHRILGYYQADRGRRFFVGFLPMWKKTPYAVSLVVPQGTADPALPVRQCRPLGGARFSA